MEPLGVAMTWGRHVQTGDFSDDGSRPLGEDTFQEDIYRVVRDDIIPVDRGWLPHWDESIGINDAIYHLLIQGKRSPHPYD